MSGEKKKPQTKIKKNKRPETSTHLDVVRVGQEHGQAVNAQTKACGGGKAELERAHKRLVDAHGFNVSFVLVLLIKIEIFFE